MQYFKVVSIKLNTTSVQKEQQKKVIVLKKKYNIFCNESNNNNKLITSNRYVVLYNENEIELDKGNKIIKDNKRK